MPDIRMPLTVHDMPPVSAWQTGRSQGVNHVLAWLDDHGFADVTAEYVSSLSLARPRHHRAPAPA